MISLAEKLISRLHFAVMATIPEQVTNLTARFDQNIETYQDQGYNKTQVRREFIDPFFDALGWDVANKADYAEAYKDVIHEDAIKVGGATKAPDYSFRVGGARKFFLEAKKPSVKIKDEEGPAYQLRRYVWSAKLPLSVLTNFSEFAVYDCLLPPKQSDKPATGRLLYLTYNEYGKRWEEIASIFSKEAVLRGSFDRFAETGKGKRGTSPVDKEFLSEIENWRESLAKNLALRNPRLSVRDLNFAVRRTIDRIIFLRMCEDRSIERYGQLQALLNGENTYKRLHHLYRIADEKYNSGLFDFEEEKERAEAPDKLTLNLKIDDKVLKDIIRRLYYPESPYEFSVLGADILGNVYEQFLGKVIRLAPGHRAIVEEKPEVKKAGGVYYTPAYIVDYIVKNTVGKLCEGKSPKQISGLRILDPACGSGSFLIGAYSYLLDHHGDWYVTDGPQKHTKEIYQGAGGHWYLTTQEKRRILLNNIYGVDIDSQAVEVTKFSLLLKVLEGENQDSLTRQLKIWRERALPDLGNNIKCGNSLSLVARNDFILKDLSAVPLNERKNALGTVAVANWKQWKKLVERDPHLTFFVGDLRASGLLDRLRRDHPLLEKAVQNRIERGVSPGIVAAHVVSPSEVRAKRLEKDLLRPSISGAQIKRYNGWTCDQFIVYTTRETQIGKYPNAESTPAMSGLR